MTTFHKILTVLNTAHPQTHFKYILIMKSSESFMRKQMYMQQKIYERKTENKAVYAA